MFAGQSSGTSTWVLQVSLSYQNVPPPSKSAQPSLFWNWRLLSSEANPALKSNTPKAERYNLHLALWVNVKQRPAGPVWQGWAAQHLPQCQGVWPALGERRFGRKEKRLSFRAPRERKTKHAAHACVFWECGVIDRGWSEHYEYVWGKKLVSTSFYESLHSVFCHRRAALFSESDWSRLTQGCK